tara:strand:- start:258 stop:644 length:387 start_codon:yes stop_codon:yes gene_type:complete
MSKSTFTKTDLKTLAKFIVDENKKYDEEYSKKRLEKDYNKKIEKLNKILKDEDSKNSFIDDFINDIMEDQDDFIDLEYMNDINKALFGIIEDLEDIVNDMNKEAKQYTKKLYEKYSYIINQKLVDKGF